jgi:hypothetical protein
MRVRFLVDENLPPRLIIAVLRHDPSIDIVRVGDPGAPELGTSDEDILVHLEESSRLLVTDNRATIPSHVLAHAQSGHRHWGVVWIRPSAGVGSVAESLYLIWSASDAEEWLDQTAWVPF